jgi:hypothetical protein
MHAIYKGMFSNKTHDYNDGIVHIETVGETNAKITDGTGEQKETNATWNLEYNNDAYGRGGLEGDVETTQNGRKLKYRLQMDNEDLAQIFSTPQMRGTLNERLENDFHMPRRRKMQSFPIDMMIIENEQPVIDDALMQIIQSVQEQDGRRRQVPSNRSRRLRIEYNSRPRRSHKFNRKKHSKKTTRINHRRRRKVKKSSSSKRDSFGSNVPLTEINA